MLSLPYGDLSLLRSLSKKMGWTMRRQRKDAIQQLESDAHINSNERKQSRQKVKSGIEKGLDDIRKGNVFHAKNSEDLVKQILGDGRNSEMGVAKGW